MTSMPNYQEARLDLAEVESLLSHYVGDDSVINVKETLRLMLGQFFYGETPSTIFPVTDIDSRTIVWPFTGQTLFGQNCTDAFDNLGEVFWSLADTITNRTLFVSKDYQHRADNCFYKFFPTGSKLVIYVPVIPGVLGADNFLNIPGPAVVHNCLETLPSRYRK